MSARCETIGRYVLPVFRAFVAKELISTFKLTQVETAKVLGTTQAAISQYLNSKRAIKGIEQFSKTLPKIQSMARTTAKRLAENETTWIEVTRDFCSLCSSFTDDEINQTNDDYVI